MFARILAMAIVAAAGVVLAQRMKRPPGRPRTSVIEESIEVDVPISTAYNQWTQFEDFPKFMEGVREVRQIDDTHLHWRAEMGGKTEEWDSEIVEQIPDRTIAWRSVSGLRNAGRVSFQPLSENRTLVTVRMEYEPQTFVEQLGDALGIARMRLRNNLQRFKQFIESRGRETGAWRGAVVPQGMGTTPPPH